MRLTTSYYFGVGAGVLASWVFAFLTGSWVVGIILGIIIGFIVYKIVIAIEDALYKGVNSAIYSGSRQSVQESLSTAYSFETTADKEEIITNFLHKFPTQRQIVFFAPKGALAWACNRGNDTLFFVTGISDISHVETAKVPFVLAELRFQIEVGYTTALFVFVGRRDYNDGTVPFAKNMVELVEIVKDTFMAIDSECKINVIRENSIDSTDNTPVSDNMQNCTKCDHPYSVENESCPHCGFKPERIKCKATCPINKYKGCCYGGCPYVGNCNSKCANEPKTCGDSIFENKQEDSNYAENA